MEKTKYKLTLVRTEETEKGIRTGEREIVCIGYFSSERSLQQWAEDNLGEIDNVD